MLRNALIAWTAAFIVAGCTHPNVRTVEAFRAAHDRGDDATAKSFLASEPRTWYESKEGPGNAWVLGRGRYADWDDEFRSVSEPGPWRMREGAVSALVHEMNDYYRLIERGAGGYVHTYFLNEEGRISGQMISAPPDWTRPASRFDEFEAWARRNAPDELEYLRPGGRLDPTGDRSRRTRILVNRWRAAVGLPPIERKP